MDQFQSYTLSDFVLEPRALDEQTIRLEWRHCRSDAHFDVSALSDGSLRFLALATLLLQPVKLLPSVLLLDEPELGLHPYAVTVLCSLVRSVASETQVILATQSPFLVDHFEPEDVIVADRVEGRSEFSRLSAEELGSWLEDYSLGDLWLKNELGGRPAFEDTCQLHNMSAHTPIHCAKYGGVSGRNSMWLEFTASEDKPHAPTAIFSSSFPRKRESTSITKVSGFPLSRE